MLEFEGKQAAHQLTLTGREVREFVLKDFPTKGDSIKKGPAEYVASTRYINRVQEISNWKESWNDR